MQPDADGSSGLTPREVELSEVLSSYADPRTVSYTFVVAFVLVGLLVCASIAWAASQKVSEAPYRVQEATPASFVRGVTAFRRGDWQEALRLLRDARAQSVKPHQGVEDYLERLERIERDEDRLGRAEEALLADDPERALALVGYIAPNSPFFSQANLVARSARALALQAAQAAAQAAAQSAAAQEPAALEAKAASESDVPPVSVRSHRTPPVARTPVFVPNPQPSDFDQEW